MLQVGFPGLLRCFAGSFCFPYSIIFPTALQALAVTEEETKMAPFLECFSGAYVGAETNHGSPYGGAAELVEAERG